MVRIQLAEIPVQMNNRFPDLQRFCRGYETMQKPLITISVSPEELEQERKAQDGHFSDGYLETVCMYRKLSLEMLQYNVFLLHASVIEVDGAGYGFLAPSGTGKTTQVRLWLEHFGERAKVINGDKPLIKMVPQGGHFTFLAYGAPWQGKEGMGCNDSVPLKVLFLLERAEAPSCVPASQAECIDRIFRQMLMPGRMDQMERLLNMADRLLETVPCYILRCNMKKESVLEACRAANL